MLEQTQTSTWKGLAQAGRLHDAIVAYVAERDFVSWFELTRDFAEFMDTSGDSHAFLGESDNNVVLWMGMSSELCDTVLRLKADRKLFLHPSRVESYLIDGCTLRLPLVKQANTKYRTPHWLPTCFRTVEASGR